MKLAPRFYKNEIADFNIKNEDSFPYIASLGYALSHELRLKILNQLQNKSYTIPELAEINDTSVSSIVYHVEILQDAGLIEIKLTPAPKGMVRKCHRVLQAFKLQLFREFESPSAGKTFHYSIGVGDFIDCHPKADYSFATIEKHYTCTWNTIFRPERHNAQIIWSDSGFLTYAFPNDFAKYHKCRELSISLELCSETINHDNDWKSEITFWLNDREICTYGSPGDFGDRTGILNPEWWTKSLDSPTQYGILKKITVDKNGVYLDGKIINRNVTLGSLNLSDSNRITLKIGNKPGSAFMGGFNLFGKSFGDYPIDIEIDAVTE